MFLTSPHVSHITSCFSHHLMFLTSPHVSHLTSCFSTYLMNRLMSSCTFTPNPHATANGVIACTYTCMYVRICPYVVNVGFQPSVGRLQSHPLCCGRWNEERRNEVSLRRAYKLSSVEMCLKIVLKDHKELVYTLWLKVHYPLL